MKEEERDEQFEKLKKTHQVDQLMAEICTTGPRLWWGLYSSLVSEGFDEDQALDLVKTFVSSVHGK